MENFVVKGNEKHQTINAMVKDRDMMIGDVCRCVEANALPLNLVKSPFFINMVKSMKLPTYHEVRVSFLKKEVNLIHANLDKYRHEWKKSGCTLMLDGWTNGKANVSSGCELMDKRKQLFWSSCAAHSLDLILEDISGLTVLRLLDGDSKPAMGYIYGAIDRAKEQIAKNFDNVKSSAVECGRNCSEQQRLNALVFVKYNFQLELRQKQREAKGDTYDHICLLDVESDDEWITKQEEPCLLEVNSWKDVQEFPYLYNAIYLLCLFLCPWNLNAIDNKNDKRKGILFQDNVKKDIANDGDIEEVEEEEIIMTEDNSDSDSISLDEI
ncbi:hypothetical protein L6164_023840 [Bauhinia variegata]|uniref:Uncharacterized protein n=1 Tax=Bauhinia variegata TaxID=167791 RepID=A0ACB9MLI4_BAUVA|nr:hypothetical protein L6164_023840 [Bauhinia variegata]